MNFKQVYRVIIDDVYSIDTLNDEQKKEAFEIAVNCQSNQILKLLLPEMEKYENFIENILKEKENCISLDNRIYHNLQKQINCNSIYYINGYKLDMKEYRTVDHFFTSSCIVFHMLHMDNIKDIMYREALDIINRYNFLCSSIMCRLMEFGFYDLIYLILEKHGDIKDIYLSLDYDTKMIQILISNHKNKNYKLNPKIIERLKDSNRYDLIQMIRDENIIDIKDLDIPEKTYDNVLSQLNKAFNSHNNTPESIRLLFNDFDYFHKINNEETNNEVNNEVKNNEETKNRETNNEIKINIDILVSKPSEIFNIIMEYVNKNIVTIVNDEKNVYAESVDTTLLYFNKINENNLVILLNKKIYTQEQVKNIFSKCLSCHLKNAANACLINYDVPDISGTARVENTELAWSFVGTKYEQYILDCVLEDIPGSLEYVHIKKYAHLPQVKQRLFKMLGKCIKWHTEDNTCDQRRNEISLTNIKILMALIQHS